MNILLKNILSSLNPIIFNIQHFKNLVSKLYNSYKDGFYVHAPCIDFNSPEAVANYITRYIGRPAMAQSCITDYDGKMLPSGTSVMRTTKKFLLLFLYSILLKDYSHS